MSNISQEQKLKTLVKALDSKRAEDIQIIKIRDLTIVADYFVICNGTSNTHTKALADEAEFLLKQQGVEPKRVEGYSSATWIILDYGDVVVHVFYKETREFYNLEKLWNDGEFIDSSLYLED